MKYIVNVLVATLLAGTAFGDELVLKDGTKIEWTNLKDLGESFEVESRAGVKVEIRKSEVARIEFRSRAAEVSDAAKANAILTGATLTFDKAVKLVQFDLLRSIDLKTDVVSGNWKLQKGILSGDVNGQGFGFAQLETSYVLPEEYLLTTVIEQSTETSYPGSEWLRIGLAKGGQQFAFIFAHKGWNGIEVVDGKAVDQSPFSVKEELFPKGKKKRTFQFFVRKFGTAVRIDGKDFIAYSGDWSRVTAPGGYNVNKKGGVVFQMGFSKTYKIHSAVVSFPKE